jgi:polysaccharide pyruvyl transferase WcaK-like protein
MACRHIALVGFYGRGNFGDDYCAVLLGLALRGAGHSVSIFRLPQAYAGPFGLQTASTPEELLDGADLLLWGGGGLLVPWRDLAYRVMFPGVAGEFDKVVALATQKGVRLAACSVGGDGSCPPRLTPAYKEDFARSASFMTVRNPQDLAILKRFGVAGAAFPDLMWLAGDRIPRPASGPGGMRIGFDIYLSTILRRSAPSLLAVLKEIADRRPDCQFFFIDSTNAGSKPYRGLGRWIRGSNVRPYQFSDPESDLRFLASLDLLVSSRLHAPMVALQFGVPVVSVLAEKKTSLLFSNLCLDRLSFGRDRVSELGRLLSSKVSLDSFLRDFRHPDIASLRAAAGGHLQFLSEQLA